MPSLPSRPNLEFLKKQSKLLLRDFDAGDADAVARMGAANLEAGARPKLADAQHVIAREHGFATWAELKASIESLARGADSTHLLVAAVRSNDASRVRDVLRRHGELRSRLNDTVPDAPFGMTPLLAAVQHANLDMVDALLEAGADINGRSHWWAGGFGVLDDDRGLAPHLIERGARVDAHSASRLDMLDALAQLIAADPAVVHARGGDGQTPLHFAKSVDVARFLLDHGADIDAIDVDHESTPAQYMVRDRQEVARFLVSRGCRTDILMAAALGDLELARRLLEADPNCVRTSVSEPYFPMRNPRAGGTIYFWTLGRHRTAQLVAREFGHDDVFQLLMDRTPEEQQLAIACEIGDEALFHKLSRARPELGRALAAGERHKLVDAAQNNNTQAVRLMLSAGWPVDARGPQQATALHWAAWHGNTAMVREILRYDPPVDVRGDEYDLSPLGWALHGSVHGWHSDTGDYGGTVQALLEAGAVPPPIRDDLVPSEAAREVLRRHTGGPQKSSSR